MNKKEGLPRLVNPPSLQCKDNKFFCEMQIATLPWRLKKGKNLLHFYLPNLGEIKANFCSRLTI